MGGRKNDRPSSFSLSGHPRRHPCRSTPRPGVTKIGPKASPAGHAFTSSFAYSQTMRGAFVVQLGPETKPEVDSCTEIRFRSSEELLKFLEPRFDLATVSADKSRATRTSEQVVLRKKSSRKERGSP
jgi:hypothetical protein